MKTPQGGPGAGHKLGAAAFNEVAGFGDDVLQRLGALSLEAGGEHVRIGNGNGVTIESSERIHHLESADETRRALRRVAGKAVVVSHVKRIDKSVRSVNR